MFIDCSKLDRSDRSDRGPKEISFAALIDFFLKTFP